VQEVSCPTGKIATGGGGNVASASASENVGLNQSNPIGPVSGPTGWHAQAEQFATGTTNWTLTAYVVCTA
jgi:hypothetical protein